MLKKLSAVAASIVAFAFVFVSIAHACSGLTPMNLAVQQSPMNMGQGNNPPCSKEKGDICQSVRDSILSVKPSISAADNLQQSVPPLQLSVESPTLLVSSPVAPIIGVLFHPVFKLPLTVSYVVLRI
jgi:hypothetical protein